MTKTYDLNAFRNKINKQAKKVDPDEFKPSQDPCSYRFFILPPVERGEMTKNGPAKNGMENFYLLHGTHWFNKHPHACTRVYAEQGGDCPVCQMGFDLMQATQSKDERRAIAKKWMPNEKYAVNIYITDNPINPEELRGRVMYYNAPKTVLDIFKNCLNRDDAGPDIEEPNAYGIFFDPNNSHSFSLKVTKNADYTEYKTSKFSAKKEPIAGTPEKIQEILDSRIDLYTKVTQPDLASLAALMDKINNASGDDSGFDQSDDAEETNTKSADSFDNATKAQPTTAAKADSAPNVESAPKVQDVPKVTTEDSDEASKTAAEIESLLQDMDS